jgi:AcrR family transcriptional regulator
MPRPLSEQARQKATEAAQSILAESGIGAITMDGVAKRSGVAKTTLYRHWPSANELIVHTLDCSIERMPTPDTGSLIGDLRSLYEMVAFMMAQPGMRQMMLDTVSAAAHDAELEQMKKALIEERTRPVREVVRRAVERGEIPEVDLAAAVVVVEGPMIARTMMSPEPISNEEIEHFAHFVARGLGAPSETR